MILVVDYGMGNLRSVSKALEHLNASVKVSSSWKDVEKADKLVLPGVGAFGDAVKELHNASLFEPVRNHILTGKPFLGICLGMQLLCGESEESPGSAGLAALSGKVLAFNPALAKVPHMGWNRVHALRPHPLLKGVPDETYFYFVHSFYVKAEAPEVTVVSCRYGQEDFTAILGGENFFATQFHPEKSQKGGLTLLKNFAAW